jgi:hypothetical protein
VRVYEIPMAQVMERVQLTFRLTEIKRFQVRIWIGTKLLLLAALVMGCGIEVINEDKSDR